MGYIDDFCNSLEEVKKTLIRLHNRNNELSDKVDFYENCFRAIGEGHPLKLEKTSIGTVYSIPLDGFKTPMYVMTDFDED